MSKMRINVPFYEAVAILYPFGHNISEHSGDLWAYIFLRYVLDYVRISTKPIFLLG